MKSNSLVFKASPQLELIIPAAVATVPLSNDANHPIIVTLLNLELIPRFRFQDRRHVTSPDVPNAGSRWL